MLHIGHFIAELLAVFDARTPEAKNRKRTTFDSIIANEWISREYSSKLANVSYRVYIARVWRDKRRQYKRDERKPINQA
jgi:hypothetical protein